MAESPTIMHPDWLTLSEAVQLLGKSVRTVERLGQLEIVSTRTEPRPGRKPETLYSTADLLKAKQERIPATIPPSDIPPNLAKSPVAKFPPLDLAKLSEIGRELVQQGRERPRLTERLYLSLDEAQTLSGLGKAFLLREVKRGRLVACKAPGWRIQRESLETWTPEPEDS